MANIKDFAVGLVVTPPSPATTGTTLTLRAGEGATMPVPPFFVTAGPPAELTTLATSEKLLVTGVSEDTLTFERAQTPTSAKPIAAGWIVANALYADDLLGGGISQTDADIRYVNVNGDTMTGTLTVQKDTTGDFINLKTTTGANFLRFLNSNTDAIPSASVQLYRGASIVSSINVGANGMSINSTGYTDIGVGGITKFRLSTTDAYFYTNAIPNTTATHNIGNSGAYWSNLYAQNHYFNSTAYIDGATAGQLNVTGRMVFASGNGIDSVSGATLRFYSGGTYYAFLSNSGAFSPATDLTGNIGSTSNQWSGVYARRFTLNPTAYIDGATAGSLNITGKVGINTTASYPLTIKGDPTTNNLWMMQNNAGVDKWHMTIRNGTDFNFTETGVLDGRLYLQAGGNVGLSTTAPTHTLTLPSTSTGIALYNTSDQTTNYERGRIVWSGGTFTILTQQGGTGAARNLTIQAAGAMRLTGSANGNIFIANDNSTSVRTHVGANISFAGNIVSNEATLSGASVSQDYFRINPTINQTGTSSYTALLINPTETATGSGTKNLIDAQVGGSSKFKVDNAGYVTAPRMYFNSTAYIDGASAGSLNVTGTMNIVSAASDAVNLHVGSNLGATDIATMSFGSSRAKAGYDGSTNNAILKGMSGKGVGLYININEPVFNATTGGAVTINSRGTNQNISFVPSGTGLVTSASDMEVTANSKGIILRDSDGARWKITVGTDGALTTTGV